MRTRKRIKIVVEMAGGDATRRNHVSIVEQFNKFIIIHIDGVFPHEGESWQPATAIVQALDRVDRVLAACVCRLLHYSAN